MNFESRYIERVLLFFVHVIKCSEVRSKKFADNFAQVDELFIEQIKKSKLCITL